MTTAEAKEKEQRRLLNRARELKCSVELIKHIEELEDQLNGRFEILENKIEQILPELK